MIDYLDIFESVTQSQITLRGNIARCVCPIHNGNNPSSFVFWTDTGRFFCHGCGERGDIVDLVSKSKDMSEDEALKFVNLPSRPKIDYIPYVRDKSRIDFTLENNYFLSCANDRAKELFDELIPAKAMIALDMTELSGLIGYDSINDTLTVAIKDSERVVQIKRRKIGDVKWKGMKDSDGAYTPHRTTGKSVIYIASGMAEYLILKASGLDYIALQSDSAKIDFDLSNKTVIVFEDNDTKEAPEGTLDKYRDGVDYNLANHFKLKVTANIKGKRVIPIDFQNMLDRDLEYGYDLRDFVTEYPDNWIELVKNEIEYFFREELC